MAIATYSDLQTSVASWLARTDLTATIPDFITLAEARINRELRIRAMETTISIATVANTATVALPTRYVQMRVLTITDTPTYPLDYRTPEDLLFKYGNAGTGKPKAFTLDGETIRLGPTPDAIYTLAGIYYQGFAALSSGVNWLITNAPDVYLYATLLETMPFIANDTRIPVWQMMYANAIDKLQRADERDRHSGGALVMRSDVQMP